MRRTATARERLPVLAGTFTAFALVAGWEYARSDLAWYWAAGIFGTAFALVAAAIVRGEVSSGAEWLRRVAPLGSAWVRTDELVAAEIETSLTGSRVMLVDAGGRRVHARLDELAESPAVWRPFVAGVARSLASGRLRLDARTRHALGFPQSDGTSRAGSNVGPHIARPFCEVDP